MWAKRKYFTNNIRWSSKSNCIYILHFTNYPNVCVHGCDSHAQHIWLKCQRFSSSMTSTNNFDDSSHQYECESQGKEIPSGKIRICKYTYPLGYPLWDKPSCAKASKILKKIGSLATAERKKKKSGTSFLFVFLLLMFSPSLFSSFWNGWIELNNWVSNNRSAYH